MSYVPRTLDDSISWRMEYLYALRTADKPNKGDA